MAEAHAVQYSQVSDVRMAEAFAQVRDKLHASLDQRMRDVLIAHMEQVSAEIRLTVATQGQEIMKMVERQFGDFQSIQSRK